MSKQNHCPGLGSVYDRSSHKNFANPLHYCYVKTKHEAIGLDHQEAFCLTENYENCPIYQRETQLNPIEVVENLKPEKRSFSLTFVQTLALVTFALALILVTLLVLWRTNFFAPLRPVASVDQPIAVVTYIITPTQITPNATWYAQLTQDALHISINTSTPLMPGVISTRTSIAFLSPIPTIICDKPDDWIIYMVDYGDTLFSLAEDTNTTVVNLMAANCLTTNSIVVGQDIYLPYYPGSATDTPYPTSTLRTRTPTPTSTEKPGSGNPPTSVPTTAPTSVPTIAPRPSQTPTTAPEPTDTSIPIIRPTPTP